ATGRTRQVQNAQDALARSAIANRKLLINENRRMDREERKRIRDHEAALLENRRRDAVSLGEEVLGATPIRRRAGLFGSGREDAIRDILNYQSAVRSMQEAAGRTNLTLSEQRSLFNQIGRGEIPVLTGANAELVRRMFEVHSASKTVTSNIGRLGDQFRGLTDHVRSATHFVWAFAMYHGINALVFSMGNAIDQAAELSIKLS